MNPTPPTIRRPIRLGATLGSSLAVALVAMAMPSATAHAQSRATVATTPTNLVTLSTGQGTQVRLDSPIVDLFVADATVADVQVTSPTQIYLFGKKGGETTVYATNKAGQVVYSTNVRVGDNITGIDGMLRLAMPDAQITATPMNGLVLLTGQVAQPVDAAEAERLVEAMVGEGKVISRLTTATPLQVNLQVRIAEVSRDVSRAIGVNLLTRDRSGGFLFGIAQGRPIGSIGDFPLVANPNAGGALQPQNPITGEFTGPGTVFNGIPSALGAGTSLGFAGRLLGLDILSALDLAETDGLVTTLAEPNLTALSGETASFLAGGEIPIPISQALGTVSVEYKQYGVSLSFSPIVLSDGRISMRVRPEVSQLSEAGSVRVSGFSIPGITTRRAETTLELGSGQSFIIGGLLSQSASNSVDKAPFLGDIPILGSLFRSTSYRKNKTELVIVVTPYLVRPVNANQIVLPTDGGRAATAGEAQLLNRTYGESNMPRPQPTAAGTSGAVASPVTADPAARPGFQAN